MELTLYEDKNIRVYSDGIMHRIKRKNNNDLEDMLKEMALKYKYTADMFALCIQEYNIDRDDFAERCHKIFGYYEDYNRNFMFQVEKSLAETMKAGNLKRSTK